MLTEKWDLFLDESGEFKDGKLKSGLNPSLVGGLLCRSGAVSEKAAAALFDNCESHVTEEFEERRKDYFRILRSLRQEDCRFVIFENTERLMIVNGDITYLNILAEGISKLLRDLITKTQADQVFLNVKIATRLNVTQKETAGVRVDIQSVEYEERLQEHIIFALGQGALTHAQWSIAFGSAKHDYQLMLADLICNFYLTRCAPSKFSPEERGELANSIFAGCVYYSVFEETTVQMAKRMMAEERLGEAMILVASAKSMTAQIQNVCRDIHECLREMSVLQCDYCFQSVSLQIGIFADKRVFEEGRAFAEHYRERILEPVRTDEKLEKHAKRWLFDTDFYLLTLADHMGDMRGCEICRQRCHENLPYIMRGWEQMDYYFTFRIRELNIMMGRFDFEGVLREAKKLEPVFEEAKALSALVREEGNFTDEQTSVSLGKVKGQCVEAYSNLLGRRPELLAEAIAASDASLSEFTEEGDRVRQYQYRAELYVQVRQPEKAIAALMQTQIPGDNVTEICQEYIGKAFAKRIGACEFDLMHYTNVMRSFLEAKDKRGEQMAAVLAGDPRFAREISSERPGSSGKHPWQIILWNMGYWHRLNGSVRAWEEYSERALKISTSNRGYASMMTFAVCIGADRLYAARQKGGKTLTDTEREFEEVCRAFLKMQTSDEMRAWFALPAEKELSGIDDDGLKKIMNSWLR